MSAPRMPLDPILAHLVEIRAHARACGQGSTTAIARRLGVDRRTIYRWRDCGIPLHSADRAAMALGLHPLELFGDAFHDGVKL